MKKHVKASGICLTAMAMAAALLSGCSGGQEAASATQGTSAV